jgi:ribosomal protein S18 acetylase RimI-like enzyme
MININIRKALLSDANIIQEIHKQFYLDFCELECLEFKYIKKKIEDKLIYVLEEKNKVLAVISVGIDINETFSKSKFEIDTLAIKKGYHKKGYGTKILNYVLDNVWDRLKYEEISVGTFEEYGALDFYRKKGFNIEDIYNDIYNDGKNHKSYLLCMNREKYESIRKNYGKLY